MSVLSDWLNGDAGMPEYAKAVKVAEQDHEHHLENLRSDYGIEPPEPDPFAWLDWSAW